MQLKQTFVSLHIAASPVKTGMHSYCKIFKNFPCRQILANPRMASTSINLSLGEIWLLNFLTFFPSMCNRLAKNEHLLQVVSMQ